MFFSKVTTLLLAGFTAVSALPSVAVKRSSITDVEAVITQLGTDVAPILAQMNATALAGGVTIDSATPLFNQLTAAFDTATASLGGLSPVALAKRQADDTSVVAAELAAIIDDVLAAVSNLVADLQGLPLLDVLLAGLDTSLNQVLLGLDILLQGVLNLVAKLLVNVAALLSDLALDLSLATLGL